MLTELTITNFAIIDRLHLTFSPGFNVLTGETGAGKSIIIDAVSLLLGGRADSNFIRAGTDKAEIEGIFDLSPREQTALAPLLKEEALDDPDSGLLVLSREIRASGHNICRINGRAVRLTTLEQFGGQLVDIHGQGEHLSLLNERSHLDFLDRYGGLEDERAAVADQVRRLREVRRELSDLTQNERVLEQRQDMLRYQVEEIQAARLEVGQDVALEQERNRLTNAEKLSALSSEVLLLLVEGQEGQGAVIDLLSQATRALGNLARIDPQMEGYQQQSEELGYQLDDLAAAIQDYQEQVEFNPKRLEQVEERLALIHRLQRKYGDSILDVLAFAQHAAQELDAIEHSGERIAGLQAQEQDLLGEIGRMGAALSQQRQAAGQRLAAAVEGELAELKMEQAHFAVDLHWEAQPDGARVDDPPPGREVGAYAFSASGLDRAAFLITTNVGEPLKPLARVASGGETSRLMLAMKTALALADHIPTLIFDEIDQGIGGRVGGIVGKKLWGLSRTDGGEHQVFCVTHLPQLAGYADLHLRVQKSLSGERTTTAVDPLADEARVDELAQMLGGISENTRQIARDLLARDAPAGEQPDLEQ